jgi:glycosyltransferase involved in cell wall biosynthesis
MKQRRKLDLLRRKRAALQPRICFVSSIFGAPWGGSEELWSRAALELVAQGFSVSASIRESSPLHSRVLHLIEGGVEVWLRPLPHQLWKHARHVLASPRQMWRQSWRVLTDPQKSLTALETDRLFAASQPALVVVSEAGAFPAIDILELCIVKKLPFVTIQHANTEWYWIPDDLADRYRRAMAAAQRCFFVSKANQLLTEKQIGSELPNAEVVWNPVNVGFDITPAWPRLGPGGEFRLACVARLDPRAKGQDILLEALAQPFWATRPWRLSFYGEGPMRGNLERLVQRLGLSDRVVFAGYASAEEIWASNHVLVLPSRAEGLPLVIVEAMLCGRPVVATDVAGASEVVEDGVTGFLAEAPTPRSMAAALERFWARRAEAQMIGEAGSKKIRELLPTDPVMNFTEKIKEILVVAGSARLPSGRIDYKSTSLVLP